MQYVGGKSSIAKEIAKVISPDDKWWDPFCGGLSVSRELAKIHPCGLVSDACLPLIVLYKAIRNGWKPPLNITADIYRVAKRLPDTEPLKAFCGFGCSFGGKWFGGFCPPGIEYSKACNYRGTMRDKAKATAKALERDMWYLNMASFKCTSFFDIEPRANLGYKYIYCDPPYRNTQGYDATDNFDHNLFWDYCLDWSSVGVKVFVSELQCPLRKSQYELVWSKMHAKRLGSGGGRINDIKCEKLFLVL